MIFVKNSRFLSSMLFFEKGLDVYLYDVVYKQEGFLDYENVFCTSSKKLHLSNCIYLVSCPGLT